MIDIYVTHYVRKGSEALNDITLDTIREIEDTTLETHRTFVVGWAETQVLWENLTYRLPINVRAVQNMRPGRPDTQSSVRNRVLDLAREQGDHPFVLLHNDVRPAFGWLAHLLADLTWAEKTWGVGSSIVTPRYIPFHELHLDDHLVLHKIKSREQMAAWCTRQNFQFNGRVSCPHWRPPSDTGHQLMMFMTRPSFFAPVGECDEAFVGKNWDDVDWGVRALKAGRHSLCSRSSLIGHIEGLTFDGPGPMTATDNREVFIKKWGAEFFEEVSSGRMWERLHRAQ
jgi:hypothetical protein